MHYILCDDCWKKIGKPIEDDRGKPLLWECHMCSKKTDSHHAIQSYVFDNVKRMTVKNVLVDFIDGNFVWREWGTLEVTPKYFVLRNDKGTRIFPLGHRRAEVYFEDSEGVFIVEQDYDMAHAERDVHNQTNK